MGFIAKVITYALDKLCMNVWVWVPWHDLWTCQIETTSQWMIVGGCKQMVCRDCSRTTKDTLQFPVNDVLKRRLRSLGDIVQRNWHIQRRHLKHNEYANRGQLTRYKSKTTLTALKLTYTRIVCIYGSTYLRRFES